MHSIRTTCILVLSSVDRLVGLVVRLVRHPPQEQKILGSNSACARIFSGSSHTSDLKMGFPVATRQAPDIIASALGLVGLVSVYCDWVRWKVWYATSTSVWQHIKLSEQIRPWDTLACCWDIKQPTNSNISHQSLRCEWQLWKHMQPSTASFSLVPSVSCHCSDCLVGLVVKASTLRAKDLFSSQLLFIPLILYLVTLTFSK